MSIYTRRIEARLLATGLAAGGLLGYKVIGIDDSILVPRTTSGISEDGTSAYYYANVSDWDSGWSGTIVWDAGAGTLAREPFLADRAPTVAPPPVGGEPSPIPMFAGSYCTDEDIAVETNDFPNLVPRDQIDAFGDAATISHLAPWDLVDPAADFVANGVRPASLVYLTKPEEIWGADPGEVFAVSTINPTDIHTLTLRRIGRAAGLGEPPGFRDRDIVAITYTIKTMLMQIQEATSEIDRDFGISAFLAAAGNIVPEDWHKINRMCVYKTMYKRYLSLSRTTTAPGAMDVWLVKSDRYRAFYDSEAGSLTLASAGGATSAPNKKYKRIQRI